MEEVKKLDKKEYIEKHVANLNRAIKSLNDEKYFEFYQIIHGTIGGIASEGQILYKESFGADRLLPEMSKLLALTNVSKQDAIKANIMMMVICDDQDSNSLAATEKFYTFTTIIGVLGEALAFKEYCKNERNRVEKIEEFDKDYESYKQCITPLKKQNEQEISQGCAEKTQEEKVKVLLRFKIGALTGDVRSIVEKLCVQKRNIENVTLADMEEEHFYYLTNISWDFVRNNWKIFPSLINGLDGSGEVFPTFLRLMLQKFPEIEIKQHGEKSLKERKAMEVALSLHSGLGQLCLDIFDSNGNKGNSKFLPILQNYEKAPPLRRAESYKFLSALVTRKPQSDPRKDVFLALSFLRSYLANIKTRMAAKKEEKTGKISNIQLKGKGNKFVKWLVVALERAYGISSVVDINISKSDLKDRIEHLADLLDLTLLHSPSRFSSRDQQVLMLLEKFMAIPIGKEHEFGSNLEKIEQAFKVLSVGYDLILHGEYKQISEMFEAINTGIDVSRQKGGQERSMVLEKGIIELRDGLLLLYREEISHLQEGQKEEILEQVCNQNHISAEAVLIISLLKGEKKKNDWLDKYINYLFKEAKNINVKSKDEEAFFVGRAKYAAGFLEKMLLAGTQDPIVHRAAFLLSCRVISAYSSSFSHVSEECYVDFSLIDRAKTVDLVNHVSKDVLALDEVKTAKSKKDILLAKIFGDEKKQGSFLNALEKYNEQKGLGSVIGKMSRKDSHSFFKDFVKELEKMIGIDKEEKIYQFFFIAQSYLPALAAFEQRNGKPQAKFLVYLTGAVTLLMPALKDLTISVKDEAIKQAPIILAAMQERIEALNADRYAKDRKKAEILSKLIFAIIEIEPKAKNDLCKEAFDLVTGIVLAETKQQYQKALDAIKSKKELTTLFDPEMAAISELQKSAPDATHSNKTSWKGASATQITQERSRFMRQVSAHVSNNNNVTNPPNVTNT